MWVRQLYSSRGISDVASEMFYPRVCMSDITLSCQKFHAVGDCEVGKTRKACKNCTCGRAEAEEKVKLGLTMDQLNNPQSACGNVCTYCLISAISTNFS